MAKKKYVAATDYGKRNSELDKHDLHIGDQVVTLYRRPDAKRSSWFFRIHIKEEKRHYRKSLKTNDLNQAKFAAQTEVIKILAKVLSGQRVLDLSLKDLHSRYQVHMDAEVTKEQIAYNTWKSHRYRLKLGLQFLETKYPKALGQRLSQIDGEKFHDYLDWRIAVTALKGKTIRRDVVRDELLTIRKMFAWAQKQKLCSARAIPNFHFIVESESPKRERIVVGSRPQYMKILGQWAMFEDVKVDINFERTRYHRMMTLHVINLVECSGMRSGEVFGLKNKNVQEIEGLNEFLIHIDKKTSKVRRDRDITVNSHIFATWFRNIRKHRDPNDFVFSPLGTGTKSCRDTFYHQYKLFRVKLKDANLEWYDLYHSRHMWVTNRLLAGEQIDKVAKAAGTSIREIEATYNHILTAQITKEFNEKEVIHFADGRREVIRVSDDDDDEMVSQVTMLMKKKVKRKASGVSRNTRKATASSVE